MNILYFDSSVWLSYFLNDRHKAEASKQVDRIQYGNEKVLISTLVILEVIEVIRKRITEKEHYIGLNDSTKQIIKRKVDIKIKEFIDKVTKLAGQGKALIIDPDKSLKDYLANTLSILKPHFGEISDSDYCFICRRNISPRYRYAGFGHYDIQHAINARDCSGTEIISFDQDFLQLRHSAEFSSLKVNVI